MTLVIVTMLVFTSSPGSSTAPLDEIPPLPVESGPTAFCSSSLTCTNIPGVIDDDGDRMFGDLTMVSGSHILMEPLSLVSSSTTDPIYIAVNGQQTIGAYDRNNVVGGAVMGHTIDLNAHLSTIAGGSWNKMGPGDTNFIGGGTTNEIASASKSNIGGGIWNSIIGSGGFVGWSVVGGGLDNDITASAATIAGGADNFVSGIGGTIPGGERNTVSATRGQAAGTYAEAKHSGAFVWSDNSIFKPFASTAAQEFSARATGGVRFVSSTDVFGNPTAGVKLSAGSSAWAALSDQDSKEHVQSVDPKAVLEGLVTVPVSTWNWKAEESGATHMGPMAQDFYAAFGLGDDEKRITTVDADGVLMASVQGLYTMIQEQQTQIDLLEQRIAALEAQRVPFGGPN